MILQEKAEEIYQKFVDISYNHSLNYEIIALQSALIAVDIAEKSEYEVLTKFGIVSKNYTSTYWEFVKNELENRLNCIVC